MQITTVNPNDPELLTAESRFILRSRRMYPFVIRIYVHNLESIKGPKVNVRIHVQETRLSEKLYLMMSSNVRLHDMGLAINDIDSSRCSHMYIDDLHFDSNKNAYYYDINYHWNVRPFFTQENLRLTFSAMLTSQTTDVAEETLEAQVTSVRFAKFQRHPLDIAEDYLTCMSFKN
jgi:hypothetical protein